MKCHSFFQESSSPAQCTTTSELPDHLLTSILSSSGTSPSSSSPPSLPSSSDPRSCTSSSIVANLSTTLLYTNDIIAVVANKHIHLDTNTNSNTLESKDTIHALCSVATSSQDGSLSSSGTLHQVFYSEDNKPSLPQYQYQSQSQSQIQSHSQNNQEQLEAYPTYPQDLPPHTQFSQEALFRSQTDDETGKSDQPQETTLLQTTPPSPIVASSLQGSTFCVLFSAQLDSPMSSSPAVTHAHTTHNTHNTHNNSNTTTSHTHTDNQAHTDISVLCVQEQHLQEHQEQPQLERSNWFLNTFTFEPVASCLLSLWSLTELSSTVEENTTSKAKFKNSLSHISRKRNFSDAVEMASPLRNSPSVHHPSWIGSVKRRKIHQFATKWTSGLAPSSFVKIYTMLDFWQVMATRGSELNFDTISEGTTNDMDASEVCSDMAMESTPPPSPMSDRPTRSILMKDDTRVVGEATSCRSGRTTLQFPHPGQILRGLWEEEQQNKRRQQMVPDNVRRQARSKTFKTPLDARTRVLQFEPWRVTPTNQGRTKPVICSNSLVDNQSGTDVEMAQGEGSQLDDDARNKLGSITTAVQRCKSLSWPWRFFYTTL